MKILFVCTGNTCRSPMAEALLKNKNASKFEVKSAGVFAKNGQPATNYTKEVLKENDIIHEHVSRLLSLEDIEWATHIFTMTTGHKTTIGNVFPQALDKTFTLKEFVHDLDEDVVDPFGGTVEVYRKTYRELDELICKLIEKT
ncbi:protein-tyrosine phosphatase [Bacillus pakistanensis]|uniref:Protein-tyrosine phosphatase n=1 Tax=Rossellomorea pakistanensis TaxID=992288 RepID=A0ABS2NBN9_9BACI|nr:low molecular weight protein arginine phosphatase [Bacillus pakistanensis]MBM7585248.1 protein-tyrosine phosphatase [Bacillus pakistanensis]